jgi:hypothetical protein
MPATRLISPSTELRASPDEPAGVIVTGYFYAVDLGEDVRPQHHRVGINGVCTCSLGRSCPAVEQVRIYLASGGKRAVRPPFGFYPVVPAKCPVCGAPVSVDMSLSSARRGAGFQCSVGGRSHYWQHRARISARRVKLARSGKPA